MAFRDFTFPQATRDFGLAVRDADMFAAAEPLPARPEFLAFVAYGVTLAAANATEKAKSEFAIAPVLLECRRALGDRFALFSGLEWTPDPARGLNGYCDFLLTKGPSQHLLGTPFVAVVEAKNDLIANGLGQCVAAMVAADFCNQQAGTPSPVHGVVTTGAAWKFLAARHGIDRGRARILRRQPAEDHGHLAPSWMPRNRDDSTRHHFNPNCGRTKSGRYFTGSVPWSSTASWNAPGRTCRPARADTCCRSR